MSKTFITFIALATTMAFTGCSQQAAVAVSATGTTTSTANKTAVPASQTQAPTVVTQAVNQTTSNVTAAVTHTTDALNNIDVTQITNSVSSAQAAITNSLSSL